MVACACWRRVLARPLRPVPHAARRGSRVILNKVAFLAAPLSLASPVLADSHVQPAVQPGGDIPTNFHPTIPPPYPPGGDIPRGFNAPRSSFQYIRREAMIPMRDGAKLYAV